MSLSDLTLSLVYDKAYSDVAKEFYLPCMRESSLYYRTTGYFSSGVFLIAWEALKEFLNNDGRIRIICSPKLSNDDKIALKEGQDSKDNPLLSQKLNQEFDELLNSNARTPAKLLCCLISRNILDVKLAVMDDGNSIFHDKVGVFMDDYGNLVGFRGTMNETYKGLSSDGNSESVDVYTTFGDSASDKTRAELALSSFISLWENRVSGIKVYDLPESIKNRFLEISNDENFEELLYTVTHTNSDDREKPLRKDKRVLRPHQESALKYWYDHNRRGILEHATGSGKTFTALTAIRQALEREELPFITVPSVSLLLQWKKELEFALSDLQPSILMCGGKNESGKSNTNWKKTLPILTRPSVNTDKLIVLSVMATASSDEFIEKFRGGDHVLFVGDEVHRLGSPEYRKILGIQTGPRLGLSATPKRYGDPEGTDALYAYFERTLVPTYSLSDAINDEVLTPYQYKPNTVLLNEEEQEKWNTFTKKIGMAYAVIRNTNNQRTIDKLTKQIRDDRINRGRIIKQAAGKVPLAIKIIKEDYRDGQKWIVYCDNIDQQMDELAQQLKKYPILKYHSRMSHKEREGVMEQFDLNGGILLSVKCLDEGIDIPTVTHALIIASSKNPREFIQRRGRILRRAEGKYISYLYDMIVLPFENMEEDENDKSLSIIETELARAITFGRGALSAKALVDLNNIAIDYNLDIDKLATIGYEEEEYEEY